MYIREPIKTIEFIFCVHLFEVFAEWVRTLNSAEFEIEAKKRCFIDFACQPEGKGGEILECFILFEFFD
jgi:hypothetical protein